MVLITIGFLGWWAGSKSQAYFEGWVSQANGIPADSNAYVYSGTGNGSASFIFENSIVKTISQNGGNGSPNGLRINESDRLMRMLLIFLPLTP